MADNILFTTQIAASGTKTPAINIATYFITHVEVPASMTGTAITLEGGSSADSTVPMRDEANAAISITINNTAAIYPLDARITSAVEYIKVVSGSTEAGARTIKLYGHRI